ncbi:MAG: hypothetical protein HFJ50_03260 [Clostridia bacterium]|jgi:hypothetical protein|nr:hypothetical protein [Clostridia bacterium]
MKYLKKINKGFILTIIVLLMLLIYAFSVEAKRNASKPQIEEACKDYIKDITQYAVLPENNQKLYNTNLNNKEEQENKEKEIKNAIEKQIEETEKVLKSKMIENEKAVKMQKDLFEAFLVMNNDSNKEVLTKYNKEITKIRKMDFDENQVTVTFSGKVEKETKYLDSFSEEEKELFKKGDFVTEGETMTLKKENRRMESNICRLAIHGL